MSLKPVIGLEIHLELTTQSKMFCRCPADHFAKKPNTQTCPVCLGLPGALPFPNQKAIKDTLLLGLALDCQIPSFSRFDRKNYFYPDLPKGFQISQYDQPLCSQGKLGQIGITRVHLEEDTAKLLHQEINGQKYSLIDFNRAGVPLVEIVSEPDITSINQLLDYARQIRQIVRFLKISSADMEKGQMRFELNLSLREEKDQNLPPYRVEVKNINSFRFLKKAAEFEIKRQTAALAAGQKLTQETRGFSQKDQTTTPQRTKEEAHDYRYFPEPDLPPLSWTPAQIKKIQKSLPPLPDQLVQKFQKDYRLSRQSAELLARRPQTAAYFQKAVQLGTSNQINPVQIANLIINKKISPAKVSPSQLVKNLLSQQKVQKLPHSEIESLTVKVLKQNPLEVKKYQQGKEGLLHFFIGQVINESRGRADPETVKKLILEKLKKI